MIELGLNIDHVATLREARYRGWKKGLPPEPSVVQLALVAERAGAAQITVHLREDRRHIQEADVRELGRMLHVPLNLEMAATSAMTTQALRFKPYEVCLVPENRQEVTTEGGLDVAADLPRLRKVARQLQRAKIRVSAFIDADLAQVDAAHHSGAHVIELHTGGYANAVSAGARNRQLRRHAQGGGPCACTRPAGQCRPRSALYERA